MKHSATTPLTPEAVADVSTAVAQMSLAAKEQLLDELYIEQPVLLGNIVILAKMDMAVQPREAALDLLLGVIQCVREDLQHHGRIDEAAFERCLVHNNRMWQFLEGEDDDGYRRSLSLTLHTYPEPALLGHLVVAMNDLGLDEPKLVLLLKSTLDLCVEARWGPGSVTGPATARK